MPEAGPRPGTEGDGSEHRVVFSSRRERRAFERAQASSTAVPVASVPVASDVVVTATPADAVVSEQSMTAPAVVPAAAQGVGVEAGSIGAGHVAATVSAHAVGPVQPARRGPGTDPFGRPVVDVRRSDRRLGDPRQAPDLSRARRTPGTEASVHTGRVRVLPEDLARSTDSAPIPIRFPAPETVPDAGASTGATASEGAFRGAAAPATAGGPRRRPAPRAVATSLRSRVSRLVAKAGIMLAALGLVATTAVPAYAQFDTPTWTDPVTGKTQTLAVGAVQTGVVDRDSYAAHTVSTALDSTSGTVVTPEVQALAQQLMTAVAQGRLTGSTPDHIFEIRYLAAGEAVPGCGIDYRVLQTIAYALTKFGTVGISDINRHCTGQVEGAGTASAHYVDGGGHAVDFFLLNGHPLTGGDPSSIQLIEALDTLVPAGAHVGQQNCRAALPLGRFKEIDDTCNHLHIDFLDAAGATLLG